MYTGGMPPGMMMQSPYWVPVQLPQVPPSIPPPAQQKNAVEKTSSAEASGSSSSSEERAPNHKKETEIKVNFTS